MPVKKATKKTAKKKATGPKKKSLWDHLNAVKFDQKKDYFDTLNDLDRSTWNSWMILRALSYTEDYLLIANELNKFYNLKPEQLYRILIDVLPKQKTFDKFINGKNEGKYNKTALSILKSYFEISSREALYYMDMFYSCEVGLTDLSELLRKHGKSEKEIEEMLCVNQ
jgi:hypothetical protein